LSDLISSTIDIDIALCAVVLPCVPR